MEQLNMFGCPTAYKSSRITRQTRRESNEKTDRQGMYSMILEQLAYGDMTAREIGEVLYRHGLVLSPVKATGTAEAYGTHAGRKDRGCRQEAGQPYKAERGGVSLSGTGGRRMRHVDLESFAEGKLSAKLNKELERVARNIQDPNTDPIKERKITVTIKIKANHDRDYTDCYIETKSVLAPDAGIRTGFSIGKDLKTGVVDMMETVNQIPGQMSFDEVETEGRPEQTFDPETGEIYEASDKVVDLRARKM